MRKWCRVRRHITAFAMCLMITVVVILSSLCTTMTQGSLVKDLAGANYYQKVKSTIIDQFNNIAIPSGLPQDFFDDTSIEIAVYEDVNEQIKSAFTGSEVVLNKVELTEEITQKIQNYVIAQGQQIDFATEIEIRSIVDDCVSEYEKQIIIPHLNQIVDVWKRAVKYVCIIIVVLVLVVLSGCCMIAFSKKWKQHRVSYMSYAFLGAGITCAITSAVTKCIGLYEKINISPLHVKNFVTAIINDMVTNILSFGMVAFLAGVVLATLSLSFSKKEIRYRRSKK